MPYRKIVAAVDDTAAGMAALRAGIQIATGADAELIALRVVDEPWPFIEPGEVETKRALRDGSWTKVAAERVTDELRRLLTGVAPAAARATPAVRFGIPGVEIARSAEVEHADLVVLGARPGGRTCDGTLQRARVPTLIVPLGQRALRRVLVRTDNDATAADVLAGAFAFAGACGSEVVIAAPDAARTEPVARKAFALWAPLVHAGTFDVAIREPDAQQPDTDVLVVGYRRGEVAVIGRHTSCAVLAVPV